MRNVFLKFFLIIFLPVTVLIGYGILSIVEGPSDDHLVVLQSNLPECLDPNSNMSFENALPINAVYEGLVKLNSENLAVEPCIAEKWEVSDNGLQWTFHLKPEVYFSDGTVCDAEAVKTSLSRSMVFKDSHPYSSLIFGAVSSIKTEGKHKVSFLLKYPYAPFLKNLALPFSAPIVSPQALSKYGEDFWKYPSGTGPYVLKHAENDKFIFHNNPNYHAGPVSFKKLTVKSPKDPQKRIDHIIDRKADIIIHPTLDELTAIKTRNLKIVSVSGLDVSYLGFYTEKPPFNNKYIRMAVAKALDRSIIVHNTMQGAGVVAKGLIPHPILPVGDYHQQAITPEQVRRILNREGYPGGMEVTLITYIESRRYCPQGGELLAEEIKRQLEPSGIKVNIQSRPWKEHQTAMRKNLGNFYLYGWTGDNGDADNFIYPLLSSTQIDGGLNVSDYKNNQMDALLGSARRVSDSKSRKYLYSQVEQILAADMPITPLNRSLIQAVYIPNITGVKISGFGLIDLTSIKKQ